MTTAEPRRRSNTPEQVGDTEQVKTAMSFRAFSELVNFVRSFTGKVLETWSIYEAGVDHPPSVYLADVDEGLSRFRSELDLAQLRDNTVICASFEGEAPIPVDSRAVLGAVGRAQVSLGSLISQDRLWGNIDILTAVTRSMGLETVVVDSEQAVDFFRQHLYRFLYLRFVGAITLSSDRRPELSSPPYASDRLQFRVHTQNSGLRIRYSPAFLVGEGTVFGSPSTPVDGWLRPSAYIFGGENSSGVRWDPGIYDLPPATEARLVTI